MSQLVILVTGASSGIGKATAELLHEKGHIVYGIARGSQSMSDLEDKGVHVRHVDVTKDAQLQGVVEEILDKHGRIDGLINNAGVSLYSTIEETPRKEARTLFDTNVFAYARAIQLVLPYMRQHNSGFIINVGSLAGFIVLPGNGWYCASKFAIEALTDALRMEVSKTGVNVVLIEPEVIKTDIGDKGLKHLARNASIDHYEFLNSNWNTVVASSMERGIVPEAVARTILKVLHTTKPRYRYFVPWYTRFIPMLKWLLPNRWVDRITLQLFKWKSR